MALIILLINFVPVKSPKLYFIASIILLSVFASFLLSAYFLGYRPVKDAQDIFSVSLLIILLLLLVQSAVTIALNKKDSEDIENKYSERTRDIELVEEYLQHYNTIGINGDWGSGKTYLMRVINSTNGFRRRHSVITIDLLSCRVEDIQLFILRQMTRLLSINGIFSEASPKLDKILKNESLAYGFGTFFLTNDEAYSEALETLKDEVKKICKTVVIVFEDLDRLDDSGQIFKIFDIAEKLACPNIKIVYQFYEKNMINIDKRLTHNFMEKYIPFILNLADIPFMRLVEVQLGAYEKDYIFVSLLEIETNPLPDKMVEVIKANLIKLEDFYFLEDEINFKPIIPGHIKASISARLQINSVTIRRVDIFLKELLPALSRLESRLSVRKKQRPSPNAKKITKEHGANDGEEKQSKILMSISVSMTIL